MHAYVKKWLSSRRTAWVEYILFLPVLFLSLLRLPHLVTVNNHDTASQAAYEYWLTHGFQFGSQIEQNVGPLGFVTYPEIYTGFLDSIKFGLTATLTILLSVLTISMARRLIQTPLLRVLFYGLAMFFADGDVQFYLLTCLVGYAVLMTDDFAILAACATLLAFLSLGKGTILFIALMMMAVGCARLIMRRMNHQAILFAVTYGVTFFILWLLCGQNIIHIPDYLMASLQFSGGYNEAMAWYEDKAKLFCGVALMVALSLGIVLAAWPKTGKKDWRVWGDAGLLAAMQGFILFAAWKHGFVRADDVHMPHFFQYALVALVPLFWCGTGRIAINGMTAARGGLFILALMLGIQGSLFYKSSFDPWRGAALFRIGKHWQALDQQLAQSHDALQLPLINEKTAGERVTYFGWMPAVMLYNKFIYQPTPATIAFAAWNHWIAERDAAFFQNDATAPPYLVQMMDTVDGRLSAQDDALAQLQIFQRYDPIIFDRGVLLMQRRAAASPILEKMDAAQDVVPDQWINAPTVADPLRVRITIHRTWLARLLAIFYKPPFYRIDYMLADGRVGRNKFMTGMAADGFLIAPFINNNRQMLAALSRQHYRDYLLDKDMELSRVIKFRIGCEALSFACTDKIHAEFETVRGLEFGRDDLP